jgi:hypothetical protein
MTERLLDEMRDALTVAYEYEHAGLHVTAYQYGQLAARKIEQALAEGWGDNDQFKVKGELALIPSQHVAPTQTDWR